METWKVLLGLAGILVVFTALAEITNTSLSSPSGIVLLVGTLVFGTLFYVTTRYGYRMGEKFGEQMSDEE